MPLYNDSDLIQTEATVRLKSPSQQRVEPQPGHQWWPDSGLRPLMAPTMNTLDVLGAAFSQNNTVTSTFNFINDAQAAARFDPVDGYDPFNDIAGYEDRVGLFKFSRSPGETAMIKARIDRERRDRETLSAAGGGGFAASVAAGILDPVNLVPLGGWAIKGGRTAQILGRAGEGVLIGAGSAATAESILLATQVERTPGESAANISSAAVFGGLLGTFGGVLSREGRMKPVRAPLLGDLNAGKVADDVTAKLIALGRPEAEARAAGLLYAEKYLATAKRFQTDAWTEYQRAGLSIKNAAPDEPPFGGPEPGVRPGEAAASKSEPGVLGMGETEVERLLREIQGRKGQDGRKPMSLLDMISKEGGIVDRGGDLAAMDADLWHTAQPFRRRLLAADTGDETALRLSPERWAERAWERGYISEPTEEALLKAMRKELGGEPIRPFDDGGVDPARIAARDELERVLADLGLDATDSPATIRKALKRKEEADALQAALDDWEADPGRYEQGGLPEPLQAFVDRVKADNGLSRFDVQETAAGDLRLNMIAADKAAQGGGRGSEAMRALTAYADRAGRRLILSPSGPDKMLGTTSRARLVKFYKRFGFKENKGAGRDLSISDAMIREPNRTVLQQGATRDQAFARWFGDSKVVDAEGKPLVVFHGAKRGDRIDAAGKFDRERATSGPMQYFTDDPEIAGNYAKGKEDTSLDYEDLGEFWTINGKSGFKAGWQSLSYEERARVLRDGPRIAENEAEDGFVIAPPGEGYVGKETWEWTLRQDAKGNGLLALWQIWHDGGALFAEPERFRDVLNLLGIKSAFDDPNAVLSTVFPVHLSIRRPLDTANIPQKVIDALEEASKAEKPVPQEAWGADLWDKRRRDPAEWIANLKDDRAKGENSFVWTSVPDWASRTLERLGYDGIKDTGGKMGGQGHTVWVPFHETQVKSLFNRGTFDPTDPQILNQSAYHGSPHIFDRFTTEAMGTGEGHQAFGWGLYFAGEKAVAEHYRKQLAGGPRIKLDGVDGYRWANVSDMGSVTAIREGPLKKLDIDWTRLRDIEPDAPAKEPGQAWAWFRRAAHEYLVQVELHGDPVKAGGEAARVLRAWGDRPLLGGVPDRLKRIDAYGAALIAEQLPKIAEVEKPGRLYHVELPHEEEFLSWEKPVAEQSPAVRDAIRKAFDSLDQTWVDDILDRKNATLDELSGQEVYQVLMRAHVDDVLPVFEKEYATAISDKEAASLFLRDQGLPGLTYFDAGSRGVGEGTRNFVVFDDAHVQVKSYEQTARGQIELGGRRAVITLFNTADASTFFHETGHLWLRDLINDASRADAPQALKDDLATVLQYLGSDGGPITRDQHELFARSFEQYLAEGKAPTPALARVFEQFKEWLLSIYRTVADLNAPVSDEIRGVFDRMLSFEDQFDLDWRRANAPDGPDLSGAQWSEAGSLSAAVVGALSDAEARLADSFGLAKFESGNPISDNPLLVALHSPSTETVRIASQLAETPYFLEGNAAGKASPVAVETRIKGWLAPLTEALQGLDEQFARYRFGRAKKMGDMTRAGVQDITGGAGGRLTFAGFKEEVAKAMRRGDASTIPEVAEAAKWARARIVEPLKEAAINAGLLPEGVEVTTAASYLTRVYDLEKIASRRNEFTDLLADWFEMHGGPDEGMTRGEYRDEAEKVVAALLSSSPGRSAYDLHVSNLRGPLKERTLNVPDALIEDFLENDVERVLRIYSRTMAADVEMARVFERPDMKGAIDRITASYDRLFRRTPDGPQQAALRKRLDKDIKAVTGMRDRIRGTYGAPLDPMGLGYRVVRTVQTLNYLRLLGLMTVSAIPDIGRTIVAAGGMGRVMQRGLAPMISDFRTFRLSAAEVRRAGTALDIALDTRAAQMADVFDDFGRYSKFERGVTHLGEKMGVVSGMSVWNAALKQFSGVMIQSRMLEAIRDLRAGRPIPPGELRQLRFLGIDGDMVERIGSQYETHGAEHGGTWWANTEAWTDAEAARVYRAALVKEVDRVIVTPGQEKPLWMSRPLGRAIGQFKSFTFASMSKALISGLQQRDAAFVQSFIVSVALGSLAYYLKSRANGREPSSNPAKWLTEGLDNSGMLGWFFEANNITEKVTGNRLGVNAMIGAAPASRYASRSLLDSLGGPTVGAVNDAGKVAWALSGAALPDREGQRRSLTRSDVHRMRRLLPFQNLWLVGTLLNHGEDALGDAMGIPDRPENMP